MSPVFADRTSGQSVAGKHQTGKAFSMGSPTGLIFRSIADRDASETQQALRARMRRSAGIRALAATDMPRGLRLSQNAAQRVTTSVPIPVWIPNVSVVSRFKLSGLSRLRKSCFSERLRAKHEVDGL